MKINFFCQMELNIKQLLDEVFVISGIIKFEVSQCYQLKLKAEDEVPGVVAVPVLWLSSVCIWVGGYSSWSTSAE